MSDWVANVVFVLLAGLGALLIIWAGKKRSKGE